jgi:hypothetical protein
VSGGLVSRHYADPIDADRLADRSKTVNLPVAKRTRISQERPDVPADLLAKLLCGNLVFGHPVPESIDYLDIVGGRQLGRWLIAEEQCANRSPQNGGKALELPQRDDGERLVVVAFKIPIQ